ncbi:MAG: transglycosylase SLT domain-containing protein [Actinobacteria bacterium]|nr:transglycosylase SLT domain-containing protein [Actinomycetota bacterium]
MIALPLLGVWAGLAAGSLGAGAEGSDRPADSSPPALAAALAPAGATAAPAADALATAEAGSATAAGATAASASAASALVPPERLYLEPILAQAARDYGLPVDLILAQAWAESGWRVDAVSNKGAVGVLQLMPDAVGFISTRLLKLDQPLDPRDPAANAHMAARFMRHLLDRQDGDVRQALIAYNQGLSGLRRKGPVPAAETYADKVLALRPTFAGVA